MYQINNTRMLAGARDTLLLEKKPRSVGIELLIFLLVTMIVSFAQNMVYSGTMSVLMITDPAFNDLVASGTVEFDAIEQHVYNFILNAPSWTYAVMLASSGFMILVSVLYCKLFEKRKAYTLGFIKKDAPLEYLAGLLIGAVMMVLPVLACVLSGCVTITVSEKINPVTIVIFFAAFILQGMGEEVLFRGYLLTTLARRTKIWGAIIISSLMFSVFHMGNASFSIIAFINIFLFGIFAAVFMLKRGSIWAVGAIHTAWNFIQGNIFGFNVSGNPKFDTVFEATQANHGWVLHGGAFGPEGGLGVTIILLIAILGALLLLTKKSEQVEIKEEIEETEYV